MPRWFIQKDCSLIFNFLDDFSVSKIAIAGDNDVSRKALHILVQTPHRREIELDCHLNLMW